MPPVVRPVSLLEFPEQPVANEVEVVTTAGRIVADVSSDPFGAGDTEMEEEAADPFGAPTEAPADAPADAPAEAPADAPADAPAEAPPAADDPFADDPFS